MTKGGSKPAAPTPGRRRAEQPSSERRRTLNEPRVPRPSLQSKAWRYTLIASALVLLVSWFAWYATTPEHLPTSDKTVSASGVAGTPLYIGMFTAPDDFERTVRISGVKVHATTNTEIEVTPVLCRRGTIGVTTKPEQFCSELVDPEGQRFVSGDSIVLKVESAAPAVAVIDRIRIAYREDVRWDTQPAGHAQAILTLAGRPETGEPSAE